MIHDTERFPVLIHALRSRNLISGTLRLAITDAGRELLASTDGLLENARRRALRPHRRRAAAILVEVLERRRTD